MEVLVPVPLSQKAPSFSIHSPHPLRFPKVVRMDRVVPPLSKHRSPMYIPTVYGSTGSHHPALKRLKPSPPIRPMPSPTATQILPPLDTSLDAYVSIINSGRLDISDPDLPEMRRSIAIDPSRVTIVWESMDFCNFLQRAAITDINSGLFHKFRHQFVVLVNENSPFQHTSSSWSDRCKQVRLLMEFVKRNQMANKVDEALIKPSRDIFLRYDPVAMWRCTPGVEHRNFSNINDVVDLACEIGVSHIGVRHYSNSTHLIRLTATQRAAGRVFCVFYSFIDLFAFMN